jgi:hypothetical protein
MNENNITTISVSPKTLERLNEVGKMGQSKDELINLLVDFYLRYSHVVSAEVKKK